MLSVFGHILRVCIVDMHFRICLEQWIKAKYERMEFIPETEEIKRPYVAGNNNLFSNPWLPSLSSPILIHMQLHRNKTRLLDQAQERC